MMVLPLLRCPVTAKDPKAQIVLGMILKCQLLLSLVLLTWARLGTFNAWVLEWHVRSSFRSSLQMAPLEVMNHEEVYSWF